MTEYGEPGDEKFCGDCHYIGVIFNECFNGHLPREFRASRRHDSRACPAFREPDYRRPESAQEKRNREYEEEKSRWEPWG